MEKNQTAVKWLQEAMQRKLNYELSPSFLELFEQAKAMEKEQIIDAYKQGQHDSEPIRETDAEQYYNETFQP
jgi:hypothetical protein